MIKYILHYFKEIIKNHKLLERLKFQMEFEKPIGGIY